MLNRKRALISLGAGIFTFLIASFLILLTWKILNSPRWLLTVIVWIVGWPVLLVVKLFGIPYPGSRALVFSFLISITTEVAMLSGLIYAALSLLSKRAQGPSPSPPHPPIQFD